MNPDSPLFKTALQIYCAKRASGQYSYKRIELEWNDAKEEALFILSLAEKKLFEKDRGRKEIELS